MGGSTTSPAYVVDIARRIPFLAELREGSRTATQLEETLDTSRTTVHRATSTLESHGLVERAGDQFHLTDLGSLVASAGCSFQQRASQAKRLTPVYDMLAEPPVRPDPKLFVDATVTVAEPGDPYAPVRRFMTVVRDAASLKWFDTAPVPPTTHEVLSGELLNGMTADLMFEPQLTRTLQSNHPTLADDIGAMEKVTLFVHNHLPFGLAVVDDRVGIGATCPETGILRVFTDTTDPGAVEWGEALFEDYRSEATPLEEAGLATP